MMKRKVASRDTARYVFLVMSVAFLLGSLFFHSIDGGEAASILMIVSCIFITLFASSRNLFHISFLSGHYAFWAMPFVVTFYVNVEVSYFASFWAMSGTILAIGFSDRFGDTIWEDNGILNVSATFFAFIYIICFIFMILTNGSIVPIIGVLIVAAALSMDKNKKLATTLIYLSLIFYVSTYFLLYWGGFGRLIIVGLFMTITFMYLICINMTLFVKPLIIFVVPFGAIIGSFFRFDTFTLHDALEISVSDSAASPYILLGHIFNTNGIFEIRGIGGWFDQIILLFMALFPRVLWESKPNGFGFQYTIDNMQQYLIDANHSVAALYLGENIYYLGGFLGILGTLISLGLILAMYKILTMKQLFGGFGVFVLALWIPTYYWGGMQAFAARFWLSCLPLVFLLGIHRAYLMVRMRRRPPAQTSARRRV